RPPAGRTRTRSPSRHPRRSAAGPAPRATRGPRTPARRSTPRASRRTRSTSTSRSSGARHDPARAPRGRARARGRFPRRSGPALADGLEHEWASDSVHLAWDGSTYAVATTSFLGAPVTVPGDRASRTLEVTNGGPTAGLLEAWIVDVELTGDLGSPFFDELTVDWRATPGGHASVRELAAEGRTRVVRTELDP